MTGNKKEKILGIVLLVIVGLNGAHSLIDSSILAPLEAKRDKLEALRLQVSDSEFEFRRITHAQRHLNEQLQLSLPNEPAIASAFYQEWLIENSILASIRKAQVSVGRPEEIGSAGHRIPFTVQAEMSIEQLGTLMDQFKQQPLLHTIRHVTVTSSQSSHSETRYGVTIGIDALSLIDAEPRESLISPDNIGAPSDSQLEMYLTQKNVFQAGYNPQPPQPVRQIVQRKTPVQPLLDYRFIAGMNINGQSEAWLFEAKSKHQKIIHIGMQIDINGTQYVVTEINQKELMLTDGNLAHSLSLGESLLQTKNHQVTQR